MRKGLFQRPKGAVDAVLRLAVCGTFLGHGTLCFTLRPDWAGFITFWGLPMQTALTLMPIIGVIDWLVGLSVLLHPLRPVLLYAALWAFLTALMRPLTGQPWVEFVERSANWGAPLALYFWLALRLPVRLTNRTSG